MKTSIQTLCAAGAALILSTGSATSVLPAFDGAVTFTQGADRLVEIGYRLIDAPAVVTVDFLTNGVSIGEANFTGVYGEVNRLVQPGERKIYWRPDKDWPGFVFTENEVTAKVRAWPADDPPPYMILSLGGTSVPEYRVSAEAVPGGVNSEPYKTTKLIFKRIYASGRNWSLGALDPNLEDATNNVPYTVTFTQDYYMQVFTMTDKQAMMLGRADQYSAEDRARTDLSEPNLDICPARGVNIVSIRGAAASYSWPANGHDVDMSNSLCGKIRTWTGVEVDLPTEAQWETACRAGTLTATYLGDTVDGPGLVDGYPQLPYNKGVGSAAPNQWGIYGMLSSRWNLVLDLFAKRTEDDGTVKVDPKGPDTNADGKRVVKGGCGTATWGAIHSASRIGTNSGFDESSAWDRNYYVFRLAAPAVAK